MAEYNPYTHDEIEAFVAAALTVVTMREGMDVARQYRLYGEAIKRLPPWHQILLIENRGQSVTGDADSIAYLYKKLSQKDRGVNGMFQPGALSLQYNDKHRIEGSNVIFWHDGARGEGGLHTQAHEDGHRMDAWLAPEGQTFFSLESKEWKAAVEAELRHRAEAKRQGDLPPHVTEDAPGLMGWLNRCLGRVQKQGAVEALATDAELYDDYREIEDHLSLYDSDEANFTEAFAEMTGHHTALYARYEGSRAAVDYVLTAHYPFMWPAYRDLVIPEMERRAEVLMDKRRDQLDLYMMRAWELSQASETTIDQEAMLREASFSAARGTINRDCAVLAQQTALYTNPVQKAFDAYTALSEAYWIMQTPLHEQLKRPFAIEEGALYAQLQKVRDATDLHGFVAYVRDLKTERHMLETMLRAEERLRMAAGLPELVPGAPDTLAVETHFREMMQQGGGEVVDAYCRSLPTVQEAEAYIFAKAALMESRSALAQDGAAVVIPVTMDTPSQLYEELKAMALHGGREEVKSETRLVKETSRQLGLYDGLLGRMATAIGNLTGAKAPYYTGAQVLVMFDETLQRGGLAGVRDEIARLTVPMDIMTAYAAAREDSESARVSIAREGAEISWGKKDGIFRPFSVAVKDMAPGFLPRLAQDMMALVMQKDGGERMAAETGRLCQETHMAVGHAIGKLPQAGGRGA